MDDYRIDSHKLIFHIARLNQWLNTELIYPIYLEIGPSAACNHRCSFCALDYLGYPAQFIDKNTLMNTLSEMAQLGIKSVLYAGEGEPLLHKDIRELILHTKKIGIDVALTTNGVLLNDKIVKQLLPAFTWLRVSLDAGIPDTYSRIHGCQPEDFQKVLDNISSAVSLKKKRHYPCTIGVQFLLLSENHQELSLLAKRLRDTGLDYLIVKPYSQHPLSKNRLFETLDYEGYLCLEEELKKFQNKNFQIIFRSHTMHKLKKEKSYKGCPGLAFWTYIDSGGDVYACSAFLGDKRFCYGNIYEGTFKEIWQGHKRQGVLNMFTHELNPIPCRMLCRLDEINRYLWELRHPPAHVNFI